MKIGTLGPPGTCSENAAKYFMNNENIKGRISLYKTFEESIEALKWRDEDIAIIPSAYVDFADIVFENLGKIEIVKSFIYYTPKLVIAQNRDFFNEKVEKVATHPSPSNLIASYYKDAELIYTRSNSESAILLKDKKVDACITTEKCVIMYDLKVVKDFGNIPMSWNIFRRIGE